MKNLTPLGIKNLVLTQDRRRYPTIDSVAPNRVAVTNKRQPWLDNYPGLVYFIDADVLPIQDQVLEMLRGMALECRFAGVRTQQALGSITPYVEGWRNWKNEKVQDELKTNGYNYIGLRGGFGAMCWGHEINLRNGQKTELFSAVVAVYLLKCLDAALLHSIKEGIFHERRIPPNRFLAANAHQIVHDMVAQRLIYEPPADPGFSVVELGTTDLQVNVKPSFALDPGTDPGTITLSLNDNRFTAHGTGAYHWLAEVLATLYLPGSMHFDTFAVA